MGTQAEIVRDEKTGQPVATRIAFRSGGHGRYRHGDLQAPGPRRPYGGRGLPA